MTFDYSFIQSLPSAAAALQGRSLHRSPPQSRGWITIPRDSELINGDNVTLPANLPWNCDMG